jgi:hypothetical protein
VNSQDVSGRNQAQFLGQGLGVGVRGNLEADWYAFAMFLGQRFETLKTLVLGPPDFVPKLTLIVFSWREIRV